MTVIRPNGISGITSITSSGDAINFFKSDGTLGPVLGLNINATSGISTFAALNVTGVLTYEDVTSVDSVGIITARSDLSIADKIIHTGDTNTAIRFPAADTITAETSGSERFRIDSSGRVMIGNTAAGNLFSDASNLVVGNGSGHEGMSIYSGTSSNSNIMFADGTGSNSYAGYIQFSHNTDTLKFGIQGNDAMTINSNKNILKGTPTEGHADADDLTLQAPSGYTGITLRSGTTTGGAIYFSDATSGTGELDGQIVYSQNSRTMTFATAAVTKLTLKSDGLLVSKGIQATANVTPTSGNGVEVFAPTSSVGQIQAYDRDNSQWNDFIIKGQTIQVHTNGSERLRIDSSGNMGLGTNSPSSLLHVSGQDTTINISAANGSLAAMNNNTSQRIAFQGGNTEIGLFKDSSGNYSYVVGTYQGSINIPLVFRTGNRAERMRIDSSGRIGIGENSPSNPLVVKQSTGNINLELHSTSSGRGTQIMSHNDHATFYHGLAGDTSGDYIYYTANAKNHIFSTNNAERMRIDSSGRLLVGTTSADAGSQLHVVGSSYNPLYVNTTSSGGGGIAILHGGTRALYTGTAGSSWLSGSSTTDGLLRTEADLLFATGGNNERMRVRSNGNVIIGPYRAPAAYGTVAHNVPYEIKVAPYGWQNGSEIASISMGSHHGTGQDDGQIVFKTAADVHSTTNGLQERVRILSAGGMTFNGDVAQANALDDYEEGTWTPALVGTTAVSYSNQSGKYVKIGRMVHIKALLQTSSQTFSNTSSALQISGLPYTPGNAVGYLDVPGCVVGQQLNFDAVSNTQSVDGDYINTGLSGGNVVFQITKKGGNRGQIRNLGWGPSGTGGCIAEFEITYYTA